MRIAMLVIALVAVALVSMVSDRRALMAGGRELPWGAGAILDLAVPVQKLIAMPAGIVRDAWRHYLDLVGVQEENERLRARLARLAEDNLQLQEALVASGRLQQIAEMRDDFEIPMLPSELVGGDVSPWFRSVSFDRGLGDGVRSGMPVISEDGLVGLVTAVSQRASRTMLLLDRQSAVDGTVQRSRARGIVRGRGSDELEFEFVVRGGDVRVGDIVITSGLGGVYPKGLRIGQVTAVSDPGARLLQTATVAPAVDFGRLEQVFVMLRRGPTMELLYEAGEPGVTADAASPKPAS
ncbi:MAG: rod shape-determining protein MreC [Myxococcales bacterium]|nr:rod shape-determining protein MreC [Myxococcales bacterium]